jgi:uncharacterized repeat protein (TIGR01451 family)
MSLALSFRARFWLPVVGCLCLAGARPATALEPVAPPVPGGDPAAIEMETVAAVLGSRTLPDGTRIKEWLPATDIQQGQVVYYTVKIRNPGKAALHNVVVTKAIPANTRYLADSASAPGAAISFSVDGGTTFAPARGLVDSGASGVQRTAAPDTYTHIRWQLRYPLAPGAIAYARFRAVFR